MNITKKIANELAYWWDKVDLVICRIDLYLLNRRLKGKKLSKSDEDLLLLAVLREQRRREFIRKRMKSRQACHQLVVAR